MLGAIIGDIVGSVYEFDNIKTKDFPLFREDCRFTDDTVMTIAVRNALRIYDKEKDIQSFQAALIAEMQRLGRKYADRGYGGGLQSGCGWRIPSPTAAMAMALPCGFLQWESMLRH